MKPCSSFIFWFLFVIVGVLAPISGIFESDVSKVLRSNDGGLVLYKNPTRALLSTDIKQETILTVMSNGTIHLVEGDSGKIIWSFSSGPSISSLNLVAAAKDGDDEDTSLLDRSIVPYLNDNTWVDLGNDYAHNEDLGGMNIMKMLGAYIASGPHVSKNRVTIGSKRTTVFRINAKNGSLINIYKLDDFPYRLGSLSEGKDHIISEPDIQNVVQSSFLNQKTDRSICVVRTDYELRSFSSNSGKVLLDGMVSDIQAAFCYDESDNSLSESTFNPIIDFGSDQNSYSKKPLRVVQFRARESYDALFWLGIINDMHDKFWGARITSEVHPLTPYENRNNYGKLLPTDTSNPIPEQPTSIHGKSPVLHQPFQKNKDQGYNALDYNPLSKKRRAQGQVDPMLLTPVKIENRGNQMLGLDHEHYIQKVNAHHEIVHLVPQHPGTLWKIAGFCFLAFLAFGIWYTGLLTSMRQKSTQQLDDSRGKKFPVSKRKKARKMGNFRSTANTEKLDRSVSDEEVENPSSFQSFERSGLETWSNLARPLGGYAEGRKIGKLFVSSREIGKGSNGTVVLEGMYDGRRVAVKRLVQAYSDVASKEIQNLIASDRHPNIVRWYGVEYDSDFVYLSLELCACSLNDLIFVCSDSSQGFTSTEDKSMNPSLKGYTALLHSLKGIDKDVDLWKSNGYPSSQLLKLMRDVVSGLAHLHELGIVHRDLKPQNILIIKERTLCAKISDMGISKSLVGEKSSLGNHATGCGSSGWQAPEQLLRGHQTRAVDLFSLGCLLFFCITGGKHPFGDHLERDINIVKNRVDLFLVEHIPEAVDLFSHLLDPKPEMRPKALNVLCHPLFWTSEMRLSFLRDASDRVELEDRENESELLKALENAAPGALGGHWNEKMEAAFITNIGHYRRYKFDSARDLLRVIRNKLNHYRELPKEIQEILGPVPEGFDNYFASRFPRFLIEVYKITDKYCREEDWFSKYCKSSSI